MNFLKKKWTSLIFIALFALLIIPQTRMPIQIFFQRLMSYSPSEIDLKERETLKDYDWSLSDLTSGRINFSRSKGKVLIVNFWATWCPPCRAEMPDLHELYNSYGDRVDFYFISSEKPETIQYFLKKKDYNLPVFIQTGPAPLLLEISSLPTTFIISKGGEIVVRKSGAAKWNSKKIRFLIDELIEEE